jgi:hypothetical protein
VKSLNTVSCRDVTRGIPMVRYLLSKTCSRSLTRFNSTVHNVRLHTALFPFTKSTRDTSTNNRDSMSPMNRLLFPAPSPPFYDLRSYRT